MRWNRARSNKEQFAQRFSETPITKTMRKTNFGLTKSSVFVSTSLCFNWKLRQQQNSHDTVPFIVTSYNYSQQINRCSTKSWDSHRGGLISVNTTLLFDCFHHCADHWARLWIERQLVFRLCPIRWKTFYSVYCEIWKVCFLNSTNNARPNLCQFFEFFFWWTDDEFKSAEPIAQFVIATINQTQITKPKLKGRKLLIDCFAFKPLHPQSAAQTLTLFPSWSRLHNFLFSSWHISGLFNDPKWSFTLFSGTYCGGIKNGADWLRLFPNKKQKSLERDEAIEMQDEFEEFFLFLLHFMATYVLCSQTSAVESCCYPKPQLAKLKTFSMI